MSKIVLVSNTSEPVRLCKNCKWAKPDWFPLFLFTRARWKFAKCTRPRKANPEFDPVTGRTQTPRDHFSFCSNERIPLHFLDDPCGPNARFFEPRRKSWLCKLWDYLVKRRPV